jgi:hypothetical protein
MEINFLTKILQCDQFCLGKYRPCLGKHRGEPENSSTKKVSLGELLEASEPASTPRS